MFSRIIERTNDIIHPLPIPALSHWFPILRSPSAVLRAIWAAHKEDRSTRPWS